MLIQPVITHAPWDAARRAGVIRLRRHLPSALIVEDATREGVWATTRRAWREGIRAGADWVLIVQDDAILAADYLDAVHAQLAALPDEAECVSHYGFRKTAPTDQRWYQTRDAIAGVAIMLRRDTARAFLNWADAHPLTGKPYHRQWSDVRLGLFLIDSISVCWVACPSLADHDTTMRSTIGGRSDAPGRRSLGWVRDASGIDWTPPAEPRLLPVAPSTRRLYAKVMSA